MDALSSAGRDGNEHPGTGVPAEQRKVKLALLWSGFGAEGYTLGVAYSDQGVRGTWVQDPEPLFPADGGHGMIFKDLEGRLMLSLHSPNDTPLERPHFFPLEERDGKLRRK